MILRGPPVGVQAQIHNLTENKLYTLLDLREELSGPT